MADIVDRLIWADTNTLDVGVADLCVAARNEIEYLRKTLEAVQKFAAEAMHTLVTMQEAGDAMRAFLVVNSTTAMQQQPQYDAVIDGWESARG